VQGIGGAAEAVETRAPMAIDMTNRLIMTIKNDFRIVIHLLSKIFGIMNNAAELDLITSCTGRPNNILPYPETPGSRPKECR